MQMPLFAAQHKLIVANWLFKKNKDRYWTRESPNGNTRNQIDYILSIQRGIIQNCEVITKVDIWRDLRMVRAKIYLNEKLGRLKFIKHEKKRRINILRLREKVQEFKLKLNNRFECLKIEEADVNERYQLISDTDTLMEVATEIAPQGERKQITGKEIAIETLDRKREELRKKRTKLRHKRLNNYTELVETGRSDDKGAGKKGRSR